MPNQNERGTYSTSQATGIERMPIGRSEVVTLGIVESRFQPVFRLERKSATAESRILLLFKEGLACCTCLDTPEAARLSLGTGGTNAPHGAGN